MRILVTGAMGHVGYEVARQAARAGDSVVAQYRTTFRSADAEKLEPRVKWVQCDLADKSDLERLAGQQPIDACIHLAAVSNEAYARPDPWAAVQANVSAVGNLLDLAWKQGWQRFILVSTGSVFQGMDPKIPILEDARPNAASIYGTTKICAELLTSMYRKQFDLPAATVRVSWVYGPPVVSNSPTRGPIPSLLIGALRQQARLDPSGGDFAASFTFIADVAEGLLAAVKAPRLNHDIYHLGPGRNFPARDVGDCIRVAVPGARIDLGPGTEPWTAHTPLRGPLAGTRFHDDTGYTVRHSLETGIRAYADWLRAHPELLR